MGEIYDDGVFDVRKLAVTRLPARVRRLACSLGTEGGDVDNLTAERQQKQRVCSKVRQTFPFPVTSRVIA